MSDERARRIGEQLRRIRRQQGLSLAEVQEKSNGDWKAVVVGAYERGTRAVSITRLARLAAFYQVPLSDVLPGGRVGSDKPGEPRTVLDLTRLDRDDRRLAAIARFADHLQRVRGDRNGRVLTLRGGDLATIASAVGTDPGSLRTALTDHGVLVDLSNVMVHQG